MAPSGPQPPGTGRPHRGYFSSAVPLQSTAVPRREGEKEMKIRSFVIKKLLPFFFLALSLSRKLLEGGGGKGGKEGGGGGEDTGHPRTSAQRERLENSLVL